MDEYDLFLSFSVSMVLKGNQGPENTRLKIEIIKITRTRFEGNFIVRII